MSRRSNCCCQEGRLDREQDGDAGGSGSRTGTQEGPGAGWLWGRGGELVGRDGEWISLGYRLSMTPSTWPQPGDIGVNFNLFSAS